MVLCHNDCQRGQLIFSNLQVYKSRQGNICPTNVVYVEIIIDNTTKINVRPEMK